MKTDKVFRIILAVSGAIVVLLTVLMFFSLLKGSLLSIKTFGLKFFYSESWNPVNEKFGLLPFFIGTILTTALSLLISIPFSLSISFLTGFYLKEGWTNRFLNYTTDLLSGIPSVIYGFCGLFFLVPLIREIEIKYGIPPFGVGVITASLVLSVMIIPYTSSIAREVIKLVPNDLIEAGYSMGATSYDVLRKIVFPYAKSGILAGVILSLGRAFGETMAITMVIGNANKIPDSLFSPANTMASVIANEFTEATGDLHLSSLIHIGLWLFLITILINFIGTRIIKRFEVKRDGH